METKEILASTADLKNHSDIFFCFLASARTLKEKAFIELAGNEIDHAGFPTYGLWNGHLVTAFYLLRHALELAIKDLIKEVNGQDTYSHDIKEIWGSIENYSNIYPEKINAVFEILDRYGVLHDAQLFRYYKGKTGKKGYIRKLQDLPPIGAREFTILSDACYFVFKAKSEFIDTARNVNDNVDS